MIQTEPEHQEPQKFCDSCWWCDELQYNRSAAVMYCHYHEEAHEDFEICDEYEDAARREDTITTMNDLFFGGSEEQ